MSAAIVDGILRRREARIGKTADGDRYISLLKTFFCVKQVRAANRAEAKPEFGALVAGADIVRGSTRHLVRNRETRERRKDAACAALAGQTMADTDAAEFAFHFDAELAAST
jgi:hypothetical protein